MKDNNVVLRKDRFIDDHLKIKFDRYFFHPTDLFSKHQLMKMAFARQRDVDSVLYDFIIKNTKTYKSPIS